MLKSLYEFEKCDRTIYDSIHEYCLTEKVNEERLRISIKKKEWKRNPARTHGFLGTYFDPSSKTVRRKLGSIP